MLITAPIFSTFPLPRQVKIGMAALFAFIIFPFVSRIAVFSIPTDLVGLSILLTKELAIGVLIGFTISLIFVAIELGGHLLSVQMGLAVANALNPITRENTPIIGQFYMFAASIVFLTINGHHYLFTIVYDSYKSIPIGLNFDFSNLLTEQLLVFSSSIFLIAFKIVIPLFSVLLIIIMLMGIVAKILPQMNIFMVAMPVKIYIGISLMLMLMPTTTVYMSSLINTLIRDINGFFL